MTSCSRRREPLSAITGTLSAIDRNRVRDQSESLSAFAGIRTLTATNNIADPDGITVPVAYEWR